MTDNFFSSALSCFFALGVNITNYLVLGRTSPLTYQVLGHLKTVLIIVLGFVVFKVNYTFALYAFKFFLDPVILAQSNFAGIFFCNRDNFLETSRFEEFDGHSYSHVRVSKNIDLLSFFSYLSTFVTF